jgi:hypothetical protein
MIFSKLGREVLRRPEARLIRGGAENRKYISDLTQNLIDGWIDSLDLNYFCSTHGEEDEIASEGKIFKAQAPKVSILDY